jgi:uncharacterized protein
MITLISPSKTLDFSPADISVSTQPDYANEVFQLVGLMKKKKVKDIQELMEISENLAELNVNRYRSFKKTFDLPDAKQALFAFKGDVYTNMDVASYSEEDLDFAQNHLRILSGLYGLLKPLDLIQPYRLEMGIRLENKKGKNLYEFWGTKIAKAINGLAGGSPVINLASQEYFKAVDEKVLKSKVISPVFLEFRNGHYKIISIFAKQARGMMADFIIKNRIQDPEELKGFNIAGYEWSGEEKHWNFVR